MGHTKRSNEFLEEIFLFIYNLDNNDLDKMSAADKARLREILLRHTTDTACLVKAADNEPVFVLRAHDATADKVVDNWCELQIDRLVPLTKELLNPNPFPKIADARECAREMREYSDRKVPD